jgi:hypothetical protein
MKDEKEMTKDKLSVSQVTSLSALGYANLAFLLIVFFSSFILHPFFLSPTNSTNYRTSVCTHSPIWLYFCDLSFGSDILWTIDVPSG